MKFTGIFKRFWWMFTVFAYIAFYVVVSVRGMYMPYSFRGVSVGPFMMPTSKIWVPKAVRVHALRRLMDDPTMAHFRETPPLALFYFPLIIIDWKIFHADVRTL